MPAPAGRMHPRLEWVMNVIGHGAPPIVTVACAESAPRFAPAGLTAIPPAVGPPFGAIADSVGGE